MQCHLILSRNVSFEKRIPPVPNKDRLNENNHKLNIPATCWVLIPSNSTAMSILLHPVYRWEKWGLQRIKEFRGKDQCSQAKTVFILKEVEAERAEVSVPERKVLKWKQGEKAVGGYPHILPRLHSGWCPPPQPWGWHPYNPGSRLVSSHQWWQWGSWRHHFGPHLGHWTVGFCQERRGPRGCC